MVHAQSIVFKAVLSVSGKPAKNLLGDLFAALRSKQHLAFGVAERRQACLLQGS